MGAYHGSGLNNRRKLIVALCAGVLVAPLAVLAQQQGRVLRIGWLSNDRAANSPFFEAFRGGMRDLGYVEGRNLVIEARFGEGSTERLSRDAVNVQRGFSSSAA